MSHIIECNDLTKNYRGNVALNNVSFKIKENTITGLIGRNGAGKTTLLKIIAGLTHPTTGEIKVFNDTPFNSLKVSANTIFVDEAMDMPETLDLETLLMTASEFYVNWDAELASRLLDYFSLIPHQPYHTLSKGMKSTFNAILGLASRCPLTILDEPTTGMDVTVRKDFYRALLKDYIDHPRTIILSSHLLNEIEHLLETILLIKNGGICLHMAMDDFKSYAVGLTGSAQALQQIAQSREVLYETAVMGDTGYLVIKNNMGRAQREAWLANGIEVSPVPADDLCTYLTAQTIGGIDDVFNRG